MAVEDILLDTEEKMEKTVNVTREDFASVRSGKASPDLVSHLTVDCYGTAMKMRDVAAITTPDPRTIMIQPWDASNADPIRKAIEESKVGITPLVDGKVIRLPIPELSQERREELVKTIKKIGEEGRIAIRGNRRHGMDEVKKLQKAGEITEDELASAEKEIQKLTDKYVAEIDQAVSSKESELMKV